MKLCKSADCFIKVNFHVVVDMEQDFNLESFFVKNLFIMKNLTNLRKTAETGVNPRLQ